MSDLSNPKSPGRGKETLPMMKNFWYILLFVIVMSLLTVRAWAAPPCAECQALLIQTKVTPPPVVVVQPAKPMPAAVPAAVPAAPVVVAPTVKVEVKTKAAKSHTVRSSYRYREGPVRFRGALRSVFGLLLTPCG